VGLCNGCDVKTAFDAATNALRIEEYPDADVPVLVPRAGVVPAAIRLVGG
jgi:hypothetical protein